MGIIRKLYDKGEETINSLKSKYQNPLREFEKELKNLKQYLKESKSLAAHINALKIRAEKDISSHQVQIEKYQEQAENAVKKSKNNEISEDVAEKISVNALKMKKTYENRVSDLLENIPKYDEELSQTKERITEIQLKIEYYENEYEFLKSSEKNSKNTSDKTIFYSDSGIISRLDKLKETIMNFSLKKDFLTKEENTIYKDIDDEEILDEYQKLKSKLKK